MTTDQTIDGVPRRVCHACVGLPRKAYCPVCDNDPAAQPQGLLSAPAGFQLRCMDEEYEVDKRYLEKTETASAGLFERVTRALTRRPAPVAVVMPSRIAGDHLNEMAQGWNSCIDAVNRLNDINQ